MVLFKEAQWLFKVKTVGSTVVVGRRCRAKLQLFGKIGEQLSSAKKMNDRIETFCCPEIDRDVGGVEPT